MRRFGTAAFLILTSTLPAPAAELPGRKAGLWEIQMGLESRSGPARVVQQCVDAKTDQMMQSSAGAFAQGACSRREVQQSGNTITIDSACMLGGKPANAHAVVIGSFDSAYTMTVTSESNVLPRGKMTMTMEGKWLGPCTADQKPGDLIMGNGAKMNILDMQKRAPSEAVPLPP
jgi:hypothetical protein